MALMTMTDTKEAVPNCAFENIIWEYFEEQEEEQKEIDDAVEEQGNKVEEKPKDVDIEMNDRRLI